MGVVMMRHVFLLLLPACALALFFVPATGLAQQAPQSREDMVSDIRSLREALTAKEAKFLAPSAEDIAKYAEFLKQPDTGICRLMPRGLYEKVLTIREGGAYYSFTKRSNDYNDEPQIGLEGHYLRTGFYGADYGYMAALGDLPMEAVTVETPAIAFLASLVTPSDEPGARAEQRQANSGLVESGLSFSNHLQVQLNATYVLRAVGYREYDVIAAFRPVREDSDGSLIILWKVLQNFPVPQLLTRADP